MATPQATSPVGGASAPGSMPQQLSPQQLQQMQLVVKQCMQLLLQDQTAKAIVAKCQQGNAADVVGGMVADLLGRVHESARGAGANVDMVTMLVAGVQVIGTLAEMLWHAGVIQAEQQVPQFVAAACKSAVEQHNMGVQQGAQGQQPPGAGPAQGNAPQPSQPVGGGMIAQGA